MWCFCLDLDPDSVSKFLRVWIRLWFQYPDLDHCRKQSQKLFKTERFEFGIMDSDPVLVFLRGWIWIRSISDRIRSYGYCHIHFIRICFFKRNNFLNTKCLDLIRQTINFGPSSLAPSLPHSSPKNKIKPSSRRLCKLQAKISGNAVVGITKQQCSLFDDKCHFKCYSTY